MANKMNEYSIPYLKNTKTSFPKFDELIPMKISTITVLTGLHALW